MPGKGNSLLLLIVAGLFFASCNNGLMYQKYTSLPDNTWNINNPVVFDVPVTDTLNHYNIYINVRNANDYDFANLYLFIDITAPNNAVERDTLNCVLADKSGQWLGEGMGDIYDNKILFKFNTRFRKGDYKFKLTQAMRIDELPEIMDMGLRIEQIKKTN